MSIEALVLRHSLLCRQTNFKMDLIYSFIIIPRKPKVCRAYLLHQISLSKVPQP